MNQASGSSIPGPHDIVRHVLDNGIVVLVRENHQSPTVVVDGLLTASALHDSDETAGLAALTASGLMRGAGARTSAEIYEAIESVGADLAFSAHRHSTGFGGDCLVEDMDLLLEIMRDALLEPTFPEDQVDILRGQAITALNIQEHDTGYLAMRALRKLVYPSGHPYGRPVRGVADTVKGLSRDHLVDFHRKNYNPEGAVISVVGDVDTNTVISKLDGLFGSWKSEPGAIGEVQVDLPEVSTKKVEKALVVPGKTQTDVALGYVGPSRKATDFLAARLANTVLGVFGLMGRLGANVRDKQGLAYYAYSQVAGGRGPGPWYVRAGVNPNNVPRAIESILYEIERMEQDFVPDEELEENKNYLIGSRPLALETNSGVAGVMLYMEVEDLGLDYMLRYPDLIRDISKLEVQNAARRYLDSAKYALATAGPSLE
ncbi:MAG: pitrilysin family protein [Chloroflexota bacterium]